MRLERAVAPCNGCGSKRDCRPRARHLPRGSTVAEQRATALANSFRRPAAVDAARMDSSGKDRRHRRLLLAVAIAMTASTAGAQNYVPRTMGTREGGSSTAIPFGLNA